MTTLRKSKIRLSGDTVRVEIDVELRTKKPDTAPYLTTDLEKQPDAITELSISAGVWERRSPSARWEESSFGQCVDAILGFAQEGAIGGDAEAIAELCGLWGRYHLNGMKAGTRAQNEALESAEFQPAPYPASHYDEACRFLAAKGLNPDRGYKYGSAWLYESLPSAALDRLESLCRSLGSPLAAAVPK